MPHAVPILMYHSVSDVATPRFRRWTVSPSHFAAHIEHLAVGGYTAITVDQYARCLDGSVPLPELPVVITFDDGYADFRSAALPVLRHYGQRATLFITAGYIGGTSEWLIREGETGRPMLTWTDLEAMAGDDLEYAAHGHSHRQMDTLPLAVAAADIAVGRTEVERRLGVTVTTFAYPHGYSTAPLRSALRDMGFSAACAVEHAMSSPADNRYAMARIVVAAGTDTTALAAMLRGDGLPVGPKPAGVRRPVWRLVRRVRLATGIDPVHLPPVSAV